jgi:hypothetical protein
MFILEGLSWLFYAADEDGELPILFGALIEAALAVIIAVVIHRLTDTRDLDRRVSRTEDALTGAAAMQQVTDSRLESLEERVEDLEAEAE